MSINIKLGNVLNEARDNFLMQYKMNEPEDSNNLYHIYWRCASTPPFFLTSDLLPQPIHELACRSLRFSV